MSLGRVINSPAQPTTKSTETNRSQKYQMALSFKARLITIALKISIQWLFTVWISIASESCEIMRSTCPIVDDVDGFMRNNEIKYANNVAAELIVNVLCFFLHRFALFIAQKPSIFVRAARSLQCHRCEIFQLLVRSRRYHVRARETYVAHSR